MNVDILIHTIVSKVDVYRQNEAPEDSWRKIPGFLLNYISKRMERDRLSLHYLKRNLKRIIKLYERRSASLSRKILLWD
ncbi:hypothetical protein ACA29_06235 [Lederbergia galactosidilytica]|uniref:Uncharacterized protein n=1 Tax=Lederbergia galactosidilytica TaxID=217031 RepID=A0A0Q9YCR3_9BACI|nr:hypothetical protein ACA29_06235 [Lederbergia galactosidilytica]